MRKRVKNEIKVGIRWRLRESAIANRRSIIAYFTFCKLGWLRRSSIRVDSWFYVFFKCHSYGVLITFNNWFYKYFAPTELELFCCNLLSQFVDLLLHISMYCKLDWLRRSSIRGFMFFVKMPLLRSFDHI